LILPTQLHDARRSLFNELLLAAAPQTYVAFDLLIADRIDLQPPPPLRQRKASLAAVGKRAEGWRAFYQAVVNVDLVGIVAKRLTGASQPKRARWHKVLNLSQCRGMISQARLSAR
jgi:ATP-dependent DNA ligase